MQAKVYALPHDGTKLAFLENAQLPEATRPHLRLSLARSDFVFITLKIFMLTYKHRFARTIHFWSQFRFAWSHNLSYLYQPLKMDIFFHHLIEKGVSIWEGRIGFLSTAHTDEDIEHVIQAIKKNHRGNARWGIFPPVTVKREHT
ncbi:MAG: hypothetical protein DRR19_31710 [Candidatus Parabeggiatoa sp. nov. 1]|nr:MAG: hypothetical protein DRR19_31710 [Gammaproteobacteria bacterium]